MNKSQPSCKTLCALRLRRWAAAACFAVTAYAHAEHASAQQGGVPKTTFGDAVEFVRKQGWNVNFRTLCVEFDLGAGSNDCLFKQVSLENEFGSRDQQGLNVPVSASIRSVIVYHLRPLIGEFFIASPEGELIKAFFRTKGTGYNRIANIEIESEFKKDLSYWVDNLPKIKAAIERQGAPKR